MLGIGKKKVDGKDLIEKSIGVFNDVASELDHGISICNEEMCGIDDQIGALSEQKASLKNMMVKAQRVKNNILQIVG